MLDERTTEWMHAHASFLSTSMFLTKQSSLPVLTICRIRDWNGTEVQLSLAHILPYVVVTRL